MDRPGHKVCRYLNQPGGCRLGAKCKFSHDLNGSQAAPVVAGQHHHPVQRDDVLHQWKKLLRPAWARSNNNNLRVQRDARIFSDLLQLGLKLMEGDVGASQEGIKLLAADEGLQTISRSPRSSMEASSSRLRCF
jgi:hypothetical protein